MIEGYCNRTIFLKIGPNILATYGLFVGCMGGTMLLTTLAYLQAMDPALLPPRDAWNALGALSAAAVMLGYRLCSMFIEDTHELNRGNVLRALLRPGFLEAGGHTFLTIFGASVGTMYGGWRGALLFCDALNMGYYAGFCFLSLGCVTYGCCWGRPMAYDTWYATKYTSKDSKVLRMRPDLEGKPLFPHATFRAGLFLKNALLVGLLGAIVYVPGLFSAVYPILNNWDKGLYYARRGDSGDATTSGFCKQENFRMVPPDEKKKHCQQWALVDKLFGNAAIVAVLWMLVVNGKTLYPLMPQVYDACTMVDPWSLLVAYLIPCFTFGYHRHRMGTWMKMA